MYSPHDNDLQPSIFASSTSMYSEKLAFFPIYGLSICKDLNRAQSRQFVGENGNAGYAASNT